MKSFLFAAKVLFLLILFLSINKANAQEYLINQYHNQVITTCSGILYDSGGPSGNYSNNENYVVTICSANSEPLYIIFNNGNMESSYDMLYIYNGISTTAPLIGQYSGTTGFTVQSNNGSNCLTFRFQSDGSANYSGFMGTIGCGQIPIFGNHGDCTGAIKLNCHGTVYHEDDITSGYGLIEELTGNNNDCLSSGENNSRWYSFNVTQAGPFTFSINSPADYDWALYNLTGQSCQGILNGTVPMIRCNYSADYGYTGCNMTSSVISGSASDIPWCKYVDVQAGQTWVLLVDKYSSGVNSYDLDFSYGGGMALVNGDSINPKIVNTDFSHCSNNTLLITFSEEVRVDSLNSNCFYIEGPDESIYNLDHVEVGNPLSNVISLILNTPLTIQGTYSIHFNCSGISDLCDNNFSDTVVFIDYYPIQPFHVEYVVNNVATCMQNNGSATINPQGGTPPYSFSWIMQPPFNGQTHTSLLPGNYTVTVSDSFLCSSTITLNIPNEYTLPFTQISPGNLQLCNGDTILVTLTPGMDYIWHPQPFELLNSQGDSALILFSDSGSFLITMTDSFCSNDTTIIIHKSIPPIIDLGNNYLICEDINISINPDVNSNVDYIWSTGSTEANLLVSPEITTTYTLTVNNACGNATDEITVNVMNKPTVELGNNRLTCQGNSVLLTAISEYTQEYLWSNGASTSSIYATPYQSTLYSVTVTNQCGTASDNVSVIVRNIPVVNAGSDTVICLGQQVVLNATGNDIGFLQWSNDATTPSIIVFPQTTTTYYVKAFNDCGNVTDFVTVSVIAPPENILSPDTIQICGQSSVSLLGQHGLYYHWSTGDMTNPITIQPSGDTTIYLTSGNDCGTSTDSVVIVVGSSPSAFISFQSQICEGDTSVLTASGGTDYLWNTGDTTSVIYVAPSETVLYAVTVSGNCGISYDSAIVNVIKHITIFPNSDIYLCSGTTTVISPNIHNATHYLWNNGDTTSAIIDIPTHTTTYSITATNACFSENSQTNVFVSYPPQVNAGNDVTVCKGSLVVLYATAIYSNSFLWDGWFGGSTYTIVSDSAKEYIVQSSNDCGSDFDTVKVNVTPSPSSAFMVDTNSVCTSAPVHFQYTGDATSGAFYNWYLSSGVVVGNDERDFYVSWNTPSNNTVQLTVTENGCTSSTTSVLIIVNNCSSEISENNRLLETQIFPNPAEENVHIIFSEKVSNVNIHIHNSDGQLLGKIEVKESISCTIPVHKFSSGIYHFCIDSEKFSLVKKVVIIR